MMPKKKNRYDKSEGMLGFGLYLLLLMKTMVDDLTVLP
jgi:hypothetical protein